MFYVYILQSLKDNKWYTGFTQDVFKRLEEHNNGNVRSTKHRLPFKIIYYEVCLNERDARMRERYLKSAWGKRYLKNRLKNYLTGKNN